MQKTAPVTDFTSQRKQWNRQRATGGVSDRVWGCQLHPQQPATGPAQSSVDHLGVAGLAGHVDQQVERSERAGHVCIALATGVMDQGLDGAERPHDGCPISCGDHHDRVRRPSDRLDGSAEAAANVDYRHVRLLAPLDQ